MPDFCRKFGLKSYPTFKYKIDEDIADYPGERNHYSFVEFVKKVENNAAIELTKE